MTRLLNGAAIAALIAIATPALANEKISSEQFQSHHKWQVNWDDLVQKGTDAGAQWSCHGDNCNLYFIVKPGVKAHLATERYGRGYCYIVEGAPTADCYREDGRQTVWTVDKPFDYGLTPQRQDDATPQIANNEPAAPAPSAPAASAPPTPDAIPMNCSIENGCHLRVDLGDNNLADMLLDTGTTSMLVTRQWATALVNEGAAVWGQQGQVTLADNSVHMNDNIIIKRVTVGNRTAYNVVAGVKDTGGDLLFGLLPLNAMGVPVIDARNGWLHFAT